MTVTLDHIYRYPMKGFFADEMTAADLVEGEGLPFDRHWAVIHAASTVDPNNPGWAKKSNFICLARDEKLGQLGAKFDEETRTLTITRKGKQVSRGALDDHMGRMLLQTFLAGFLPPGSRGNPKIVEAKPGEGFTDTKDAKLSIINLASVTDIERVARRDVHPLRFRGNFYIKGAEPWREFDWIGQKVRIGGSVLEILEKIDRCAATNINPETGQVDMNLPLTLRQGFGHIDCGVHARVVEPGHIETGDTLEVLD